VLEPQARTVMAGLVKAAGRPMEHDLRAMTDAVFYVARNGVEWRALPVDFPPWEAVWKFFERWSARGLPEALTHRLRGALRERQGRAAEPTAVIVDSQIARAADTVGKGSRGFHGGKKINGRGRHAAVDAEGWLLPIVVTGARISDRAGAKLLVVRLLEVFTTLKIMWAVSGYDGKPLATRVRQAAGITLQIIKRSDLPGFQVVSRRRVGRAHLRLADALPAPGPRLRTQDRTSRGHGLLGHSNDHDTQARQVRDRHAPDPAMGRRTRHPATRTRSTGRLTLCLQALSLRWFEPNTCHHLRKQPVAWAYPGSRAVLVLSRRMSWCAAVSPCIAVVTDIWRTESGQSQRFT
jgi:transposase